MLILSRSALPGRRTLVPTGLRRRRHLGNAIKPTVVITKNPGHDGHRLDPGHLCELQRLRTTATMAPTSSTEPKAWRAPVPRSSPPSHSTSISSLAVAIREPGSPVNRAASCCIQPSWRTPITVVRHRGPMMSVTWPRVSVRGLSPVGLEYRIVAVTRFFSQQRGAVRRRSWMSPPRTCFRRIRCSARLISGGPARPDAGRQAPVPRGAPGCRPR